MTSRRADEPTSRRADEPTSRRADEPSGLGQLALMIMGSAVAAVAIAVSFWLILELSFKQSYGATPNNAADDRSGMDPQSAIGTVIGLPKSDLAGQVIDINQDDHVLIVPPCNSCSATAFDYSVLERYDRELIVVFPNYLRDIPKADLAGTDGMHVITLDSGVTADEIAWSIAPALYTVDGAGKIIAVKIDMEQIQSQLVASR